SELPSLRSGPTRTRAGGADPRRAEWISGDDDGVRDRLRIGAARRGGAYLPAPGLSVRRPYVRSGFRALALVGVLLAVLAVRVTTGARAELARGDHLVSQHDPDGAILAFRRAARWYAPGNPYCTDALDRLSTIAIAAERAGDVVRALAAWRAI